MSCGITFSTTMRISWAATQPAQVRSVAIPADRPLWLRKYKQYRHLRVNFPPAIYSADAWSPPCTSQDTGTLFRPCPDPPDPKSGAIRAIIGGDLADSSSYWKYLVYSIERPVHLLKNLTCSSVHKDWWRRFVWNWLFNLLRNWFPFISEETSCDMCRVLG